MEDIIKHIVAALPAIACIGLAGYLAGKGNPSWGWFLFAAVLVAGARLS